MTSEDIANWRVQSTGNSETTGIENYYILQTVNGIDIKNSNSNVWYKNGKVINIVTDFIENGRGKVNSSTPSLSVEDAFLRSLSLLGEESVLVQILSVKENNEYVLTNGTNDNLVNASLVYQPVNERNELKLSWSFEFYTQDYKHLWNLSIDANSGKILEQFDGVLSCNFGDSNHENHNHNFFFSSKLFKNQTSAFAPGDAQYRVIPFEIESPNHGSRQLLSNPQNAIASPFGWHDTNGAVGAEYTITRGNNVYAQDDINGNNGFGASPDGGASLIFDYPYGGTGVAASTYINASTTNIFYINNIMHDLMYQYGFNEANGNFQSNNYGNGGAGADYVIADAQDGSSTNNANFSTPTDNGFSNPRMQMFLWNVAPVVNMLTVNLPSGIAGEYSSADNGFSPGHVNVPASPGITQNLVLYQDGTGSTNEGCSSSGVPANAAAMSGKIVLIRRGGCSFAEKVKNAQNAGAVAVIIFNAAFDGGGVAQDPNVLLNMGGADASITIPAIAVSFNTGEAFVASINAGNTINVTLKNDPVTFVNSDGDFDNVVVAHEYGHGISSRLTGGRLTSCLSNQEQMGEGWSDFFGLMLQMKAGDDRTAKRGIGTFAFGQPTNGTGIRAYAYSTDMSVNPFTFASSNTQVAPHGVGSVWATMLWDLAWAYVDKYGFDADKYNGTGGNNKVLQLVIDGLKLQGCNPTFVSGRNALIAADQATTGGQDFCLIWEVFARRGLGVNASSGSANLSTDQVEDFTTPPDGPNCSLATNYFENEDMIRVYPNPSNGMLNIAINNYSGELNIQIFDLNGRNVYSQDVNDFNLEKTLDLNSLQTGIYLLKMNGQDLSSTKKIILN